MPPAPTKVIGRDGLSGTIEAHPGAATPAGGARGPSDKASPDAPPGATTCPPGTVATPLAPDAMTGAARDAKVSDAVSRVTVRLDDGRRVLVPVDVLKPQADGTFFLPIRAADLPEPGSADGTGEILVPLLEEQLNVKADKVETGRVRVTKLVREEQEVIDRPLLREQVDVRRVPVNQFVDGPVAARNEGTDGETLVIPLLEEVLVVEKRLMLREEVHVTRRREVHHDPQHVTVRREEAQVERLPGNGNGGGGSNAG